MLGGSFPPDAPAPQNTGSVPPVAMGAGVPPSVVPVLMGGGVPLHRGGVILASIPGAAPPQVPLERVVPPQAPFPLVTVPVDRVLLSHAPLPSVSSVLHPAPSACNSNNNVALYPSCLCVADEHLLSATASVSHTAPRPVADPLHPLLGTNSRLILLSKHLWATIARLAHGSIHPGSSHHFTVLIPVLLIT
jgi:hypothetical protein